jgi:hypothetical protein
MLAAFEVSQRAVFGASYETSLWFVIGERFPIKPV